MPDATTLDVDCVKDADAQLSEEPTVKLTTAPHWFASLLTVIFAGQVITGGSLSITVMVKVQVAAPQEFVAVAVTVVVPTGNTLPGACE